MAITQIDGTRQIKAASITNASQNFGTPSASTDVATKSYVDGIAQGLSAKPSAKVATTTALSPANTYSGGILTATGNGVLTIDGYATALGDVVLIMNESAGANNGLYTVTTAGAVGTPYVLTRSTAMSTSSQFQGAYIFVEIGTVNEASGWVCTNIAPTIGTTAITFVQFSGAGEITAGNGLSKTANTLSINTLITADLSSSQTLTNKTLTAPILNSGSALTTTSTILNYLSSTGGTTGTTSTNIVFSTSPTLVTPILGAASATSLVLTSFLNEAQAPNISSATTTNIGATTGNYVVITGTTTITAFDTVQAGTRRVVSFSGILTLTYNGTSLILPGGTNITTASGDTATFISLGSGNWICVNYNRASGQALVATSSPTYSRATTVSGTQDGANKTFTIANTLLSGSEQVFINGQLLTPGSSNDYVYDGTVTVTFQSGFTAPASTDVIRCYGVY